MALVEVHTQQFPNAYGKTGFSDTFVLHVYVEEASIGHANIYMRLTSSHGYDWYINHDGNCPIALVVDGVTYLDANTGTMNDMYNFGAHGDGLDGVTDTGTILFVSNIPVTKSSILQITINCSSYPIIYTGGGSFRLGWLDTGIIYNAFNSITTTTPPVISNLKNSNPYNSQQNVSASTTSISVSWTQSSGSTATYGQYSLSGGSSWTNFGSSPYTSGTISGLTPGTNYAVDVRSGNAAGTSNSLYMAIRTRHNAPVVSITGITAELEALNVSWSSDKDMASVQYQLNGTSGSWITSGNTGKSGTFRIPNLNYNTTYTVYVRGTSTSTYDSLLSNTVNSSERTLDISHITNISSIIFGMSFTVTIDAESDNDMSLKIWTEGNERVAEVTYIPTERSNVITFTQDQLDEIYKTYPRANTVEVHFVLSTIGENATYDDDQEDTVITLTGIARTAHIGIGGIPKRSDVFIGTLTGVKRCVVWIGDEDGTPRRCI